MQQIQAVGFASATGRRAQRRWVVVGLVGLLHVGLVYALVTGLAARFVEHIPTVIQMNLVKQPPQVQHQPPAPPAPQLAAPNVPQIPIPRINVAHPPPPQRTITSVAVPKPVVAPPKPAPVAPPVPPVPARAIAGTHTTPPYPPIARRLNMHGTVRLRVDVDASGTVRNVQVVNSSGSDILDRAASGWVLQHWRYKPATRNGKPVASTVLADVRFDLLSAR